MARRFIVKDKDVHKIDDNMFEITGDEVKHIHVLRHTIGDEIIVNEYKCIIDKIGKDIITLNILSVTDKKGEPNMHLDIYQAMLKGDKMDFLVQKEVELGVKSITPFFSKNVVVKLDEKDRLKRQDKLQKIADEACKQCGRTDVVVVDKLVDFNSMINELENYDLVLFAYEGETNSLKSVIEEMKNTKNEIYKIAIIIGAEGGFDNKEADILKNIPNVKCISLGERILRAETATINLTSIIMYEFEI